MPPPPLILRTLGDCAVRNGDVVGCQIRPRDFALLVYLAWLGRPVYKDEVVEFLWPRATASHGRHSLSQSLYRIKQDLNYQVGRRSRDLLIIDGSDCLLDARSFHSAARTGNLADAFRQYTGAFLGGFALPNATHFNIWVDGIRSELLDRFKRIGCKYIAQLEAERDWFGLVNAAEKYAAQAGPDREVVEKEIRTLLLLGRHDEAEARTSSYGRTIDELGGGGLEWLQPLCAMVRTHSALDVSLDPTTAAPPPKFVGRGPELALLRDSWDAVASGQRSTSILLLGEAGIGKSRLAERFARLVVLQGGRVLGGRCARIERRIPYAGIIDTLRSGLRVTDCVGIDERLAAAFADFLPELGGSPDRTSSAGAEWSQRQLFETVAQLLKQTAVRTPLLLLIDDAHWADESSIALLGYIRGRLPDARILILLAARAENVTENRALAELLESGADAAWTTLELTGLDTHSANQLISAFEQGHHTSLASDDRSLLISFTGGRPFFLIEALHEVQEQLRSRGKDPADDPRPLQFFVSTRLQEHVRERLAGLSAEALNLANAVAVSDRYATLHLSSNACAMPLGAALQAYNELVRHRLVCEDGAVLKFTHELLRQSVYNVIPAPARAALHRSIGLVLIGEADVPPGTIADHLIDGGDRELGHQFAVLAARAGERACAFAHAEYYWQLALQTATSDKWHKTAEAYGYFLIEASRLAEALQVFEQLVELYDRQDDPQSLLTVSYLRLASQLANGSNPAGSLLEGFQDLALRAEACGDTSRLTQVLGSLAEAAHDAGRDDLVGDLLAQMTELAKRLGIAADAAELLRVAARLQCVYGSFDDALRNASEALQVADAIGSRTAIIECRRARAATALMCGNVAAAKADLEVAAAGAREPGLEVYRARVTADLGVLLLEVGAFDEAREVLNEVLEPASNHERIYVYSNLAALAFEVNDVDLTRRTVVEIKDCNRTIGARWVAILCETFLGLAALHAGLVETAEQHWANAGAQLAAKRTVVGDARYWHILNARILAQGNIDAAVDALRTVLESGQLSTFSRLRLRLEEAELILTAEPKRAMQIATDVQRRAEAVDARSIAHAAGALMQQLGHTAQGTTL